MSKKRVTPLSLKQKLDIIKENELNIPKKIICDIYKCDISTVNRILKKKADILRLSQNSTNLQQQRMRKGKYANVEKALTLWYDQHSKNITNITSAMLLNKAKEFSASFGEDFAPDTTWLFRWKKRQNIKLGKSKGGGDPSEVRNEEAAIDFVGSVPMKDQEAENVMRADEVLPSSSYHREDYDICGPNSQNRIKKINSFVRGGSKRNLKRLIHKQKAIYAERLSKATKTRTNEETITSSFAPEEEQYENEENSPNEYLNNDGIKMELETEIECGQEQFEIIENIVNEEEFNNNGIKREAETDTLNEQLSVWYDKNCPHREGFEELLSILREEIIRKIDTMYPDDNRRIRNFQPYSLNETIIHVPNNAKNSNNCTNQCETKLQQITETVADLKSTIEKLQATIVSQNSLIMEALATQKALTEKLIGKEKYKEDIRAIFPIKTIEELTEINNNINETNISDYTRCLSALLRGELHKTVKEIFSVDVIVASNVDGIHGKLSVKQFKRLFEVLMDAIESNGEEDPEKALRNAFKLAKKRYFQAVCINKKKENNSNNVNNDNSNTMEDDITSN